MTSFWSQATRREIRTGKSLKFNETDPEWELVSRPIQTARGSSGGSRSNVVAVRGEFEVLDREVNGCSTIDQQG
jgi:hypothetical protein